MKQKYLLIFVLFISPFVYSQNYYHDTQGKLEISNSGSAVYTLPIAMPPSIQNVGPVINLIYNSGQLGGIAGQGWSINSISTISRIATRKDIDGFIDGVDFDSNDKLALDGQRLILKTGTYFASGSTYETETFSNTKIELQGVGTSMYFVVTTPDGSRSWYGNYGGTNAVDLTAFYITRFEDANGNYFTYHYTKPSSKNLCISEIKFSANTVSNITPQNSIKFNYGTAKRTESGYLKGVKIEKVELLKNIEVTTNGQLFRKYILTHDVDSQLGYERVVKLQEFNGNNEPANPVGFEYETTTMDNTNSETVTTYTTNLNFNDVKTSGDFDGDGRLDFIADNSLYTNLFTGTNSSKTAELPSTAGRLHAVTTLKNNKLNQFNSVLSVEATYLDTELRFRVYNLNGNTFVNDYTKVVGSPSYGSTWTPHIIGDFNGDGISEVFFNQYILINPCNFDPNNTINFPCESETISKIRLLDLNPNSSIVDGSQGLINLNNIASAFNFTHKNIVMDFNGDGKDDILSIHKTINSTSDKSYKIYSFKQLTVSPWIELEVIGSGVISDYVEKKQLLFGDFNGDGKTDLMLPDSEGGEGHALWHIYYSNPNPAGGAFFVKESHEIVEYRPDTGIPGTPGADYETQVHYSNYYAMDTNGDGKSDLVRVWRKHYKNTGVFNWNDHNTQWTVTSYVNNIGNSLVGVNKFQLDYQSPCYTTPIGNVCNHNSDSPSLVFPIVSNYRYAGVKQDLVIVHNHYDRAFYIKFKKDVSEDARIKKITSSGGNITDLVVYAELELTSAGTNGLGSLGDFYSSGDAVSYPLVELKRVPSAKMVTAVLNSSAGEIKLQSFKYHGLVVNMAGIGTMGFRKTARSAWLKVGGGIVKSIWNVEENNFLWRGATERSYSQLLNDSNEFAFVASGTPPGIISSTVNVFANSILSNKVFKISLTSQTINDYLSDFKTIKSFTYSEPYLLPEKTTTKNYFHITRLSTLQGTYTIENEFENNPTGTGNGYYIGRPKRMVSTNLAYNDTQSMEEKFTYTGNKLTKKEKKPINATGYYLTEDFEYFANGNLKKKTLSAPGAALSAGPRSTEYTYDPSERFIKTVKDVEGLVTTYNTYHQLYGVVLSETNPYAQATTSVYDNWGKRTKITDYLEKSVNYTYTKSGSTYTTHQVGEDGSESKVFNDALGRIISTCSKNINGSWSCTNTEYDFLGRKSRSSEPYFAGDTPSQWNTIVYDDYSRVKQNIAYTGLTTTITYAAGQFDSGAKVTINDGTKTTSTTKNSNGHTLSATDPGGTITYTYDSNGNMKKSVFDGVELTMEYDLWGRKITLVDPSAGTYRYEYYPFGEVYKEITPKGTTQYEYTSSGKLDFKSIIGDNTYQLIWYQYNANKQLSYVDGTDANGNTTSMQYLYDTNKRLKKTIETNLESSFENEMEYDAFGRVSREYTKATDIATGKSSAKWIRNTYLNGYHWQILDDTSNVMLWQLDEVNERGQLVRGHYGNAIGRVSKRYDSYGMPLDVNYRTINGTYASVVPFLTLTTDFNAQRGLLNLRSNSMFNLVENFQYDSQERLTHFPNALGQAEQQDYDNKGRITQNSTGAYTYGISLSPYRASKITLSAAASTYYNARPLQEVSYNAFKSPVSIYEEGKERINFEYNIFQTRTTMYYGGLQTDKTLRPLRKYYSADGVMEIKRNVATGVVDFITYIGGDGYSAPIILKSDGNTQNYYYLHRDYLGSIMAVSNAAGQVVEKRHFDAWGNIVKLQNGTGTNLTAFAILDRGYTGHEHLLNVGLINMNGRLYDPKVHRFLAPDNYIQDPSNTQNFNRYGYVLNNPLKYTDPSGEEAISFGLAVGIGAFIAATSYSIQAGYTYGFQASGWGFLKSTIIGAASAAASFGIGEATSTITHYVTRVTTQAVMHGFSQGVIAGVQGGDFLTGFASGSLSSLASSFWSGGDNIVDNGNFTMSRTVYGGVGALGNSNVGMIVFGSVMGGAGATLTGGNFWEGAVTGLVVSGLNHALHSFSSADNSKAVREKIASNAESKLDSGSYGYDVEIDNFDSGTWKCNKFVYDVTTESGASPGTPNGMFNTSPPTAGQWADAGYNIKNWRVVSTPQRGDVVAYSNPNYTSATGHTGVMVSKTHSISAGATLVQKNDFGSNQSRIQGGSPYVYRRYYAPIRHQIYIDPYWSRRNRAGSF